MGRALTLGPQGTHPQAAPQGRQVGQVGSSVSPCLSPATVGRHVGPWERGRIATSSGVLWGPRRPSHVQVCRAPMGTTPRSCPCKRVGSQWMVRVVVGSAPPRGSPARALCRGLALGHRVANMDAGATDDVVLSTEGLGHVWVYKGDEGKGPERLGDEHVRHFPKLGEIVSQVVRAQVLRAPPHKHLAAQLRCLSVFGVGNLDITPAAINEVPLAEGTHLRLVAREADEPKAL